MPDFATPWAFALLLAIPLLLWLRRYRKRPGLRYPGAELVRELRPSLRQQLVSLPLWLRVLALVCLIIALARPREGFEKTRDSSKGIAIEMVIDRSSSMSLPARDRSRQVDKLTVVKEVFEQFVMGNPEDPDDLPGRPNDLIGIIAFAKYADTICPLTLAHDTLPEFLKTLHVVSQPGEDGTAIADGLMLAAARLKNVEQEMERYAIPGTQGEYEIKSKVVILLSDGEDTASETSFEDAAAACKEWGIKVYSIGIASDYVMTNYGPMRVQGGEARVGKERLAYLAEKTGGKFFLAEDSESLAQIYAEIDKLEKSEIETVRYVDYAEAFMLWAWIGLALLGLEWILARTYCRTTP